MTGGARCLLLIAVAVGATATAADIRERIRLAHPAGTAVSQAQADVLTLTLTEIQVRPIQSWVRTAGAMDSTGRMLAATLRSVDAGSVKVGQRARVFSPDSKSSMHQARITRVTQRADEVLIEARLSGVSHDLNARYVLEVVVDYGEFLSVPNEAIVEESARQLVYVKASDGSYQPREIATRLQGERYTQVLRGVEAGEQVVTTGSFFVDAEYKMKGGN
ncbi:MAG: hypothetical protein ABI645_08615 [Pseudomonadota bacterium]